MHRGLPSLLCALLLILTLPSCGGDGDAVSCAPDIGQSIAREWNEAALDAVRLDYPSPTVHARNLFHLSAVVWDTWRAFDGTGRGVFLSETVAVSAEDLERARHIAVSHAAHTFLARRYAGSPGALASLAEFDAVLARHCYDEPGDDETEEWAAFGRRVAGTVIDATIDDGSLEPLAYKGPYEVVNPPLRFEDPGAEVVDVNRWQPLEFSSAAPQFDLDIDGGVQTYTTPQWGSLAGFAIDGGDGWRVVDPGPPPRFGEGNASADAEFLDGIVEVILASSELDASSGRQVDTAPDGAETNLVPLGDWGRAIAEFWADGPASETPPGHWNTIANEVTDHPDFVRRLGGAGPELDQFGWDVRMYLALNGALHDAAIATWGVKHFYDYSRPITMIRHLGARGDLPSVDGLIETITSASSAPGARHEHLADHIGETAIRSWVGPTATARPEGPVGWIRAVEWVPYQQADFVTPAFPGYVSGHSAFSAAAAEILTQLTGDPQFPGGIAEWTIPAGSLAFDDGPSVDVTLQWTTYADAADEAGLSRIYGGIHVPVDDGPGRGLGRSIAARSFAHAREVWDG